MQVGVARRHAAARGAHEESLLDQERLDHVLERAALLAHRGGQASMPTGPPSNFSMIVEQQLAVQRVEALRIHFEQIERGVRHRLVDAAVGLAPRRSRARGAAAGWRYAACRASACAMRARAVRIDRHAEDAGRARDDAARAPSTV